VKTAEAPITFPNPVIPDMLEMKVPLLMIDVKVELIAVKEGSVELAVELTLLVITATMVVDPLTTPTILTRDVSTMLSSAHKLLMKLVTEVLLLKKSLIFIEKWVVS